MLSSFSHFTTFLIGLAIFFNLKFSITTFDILKRGEWEYRAVSAATLSSYKNEESINSLLESITDKNWYVRYNSAISLLHLNQDIINLVFLKGDKYSRDIIFYAMFMEGRISYEEYLEKSIYLDKIKYLEVINNV